MQIDKFEISLDNEVIKMVESQKLLGVLIDKYLTWDKQIDALCLNITRRITLLKILSKYIDKTSMNTSHIITHIGEMFTWNFT